MENVGNKFMKATSIPFAEQSDQARGIPQPPFESIPKHIYEVINLPNPKNMIVKNIDLRSAVENRKSVRKYSSKPLTIDELSYLLWCTQGVKKVTDSATYRNVPSAGSRHALETYLLINNVDCIRPGLYKYMAIDHKLSALQCDGNTAQDITDACPMGPFVKSSALTFIWSAVFYRMVWRHGQRGYRYVHLDCGHVCQNLYLAAQSIGSGACGISVFVDEKINSLIGVDGVEESVIYLASVGKE